MTATKVLHPARYPENVILVLRKIIREEAERLGYKPIILDPYAGMGGIHKLGDLAETVGVELEEEWASQHPRTIVGNALCLPADWSGRFDAIVTSPTWSNRYSDSHDAQERCRACKASGFVDGALCPKCEGSGKRNHVRRSYTHDLGRDLHPDNSGRLGWGAQYARHHEAAYLGFVRVLRPDGLLALNISDHIAKGKVVPVVDWHRRALEHVGFRPVERWKIAAQRMRYGANHEARVEAEEILVMRKGN